MQTSLGVKNTYTTICTGAYLRTTPGTSKATKTLKIVHNLAGSSLPLPKEFSTSNYYSSKKFLFNYHCQKTDTDTDKRLSHRESERRGGVRGKGGKQARILTYIPCAISSRVSVSSCPKQNEGQSSPILWEKAEPIWGAASQTAWLGDSDLLLFSRNNTFLKRPIRSRLPSIDDVRNRKNAKCQEDSNKKEKPQTSLLLLLSKPPIPSLHKPVPMIIGLELYQMVRRPLILVQSAHWLTLLLICSCCCSFSSSFWPSFSLMWRWRACSQTHKRPMIKP